MYSNFQYEESSLQPEKAFLITIRYPSTSEKQAHSHIAELKSLADTMGIETAGFAIVSIKKPGHKYLIGSGKAEEMCILADESDAEIIIFDDDLTPVQQRNWEHLTDLCVIDRREVILEIFAKRASTREAVLQVALARMEYSLPRLTRAWTHLSRQRGGTKGTRGEGETQLEVDRRIVLKKITRLKKELDKVKSHRSTMRKKREKIPLPAGAIVGYTNAGKSSLLNILTRAGSYVEDKLFATLDPTTKKVILPEGKEILLTDTVGFIRKLPHNLIDAFKSTLEEAVFADFLLHVIDISNPEFREQYKITIKVLEDLEAAGKPMILIFNKTDLCHDTLFLKSLTREFPDAVFFSSRTGKGEAELYNSMEALLVKTNSTQDFVIPSDRYDLVAMIHRKGKIIEEEYKESSTLIRANLSDKTTSQLRKILLEVYNEPGNLS